MSIVITRSASLVGIVVSAAIHLVGYFYLDLPYTAYLIPAVGILILAPIALKPPFLDARTQTRTVTQKITSRAAAAGLVLWLAVTFIWLLVVQTPKNGIGPHPVRLSAIWPVLHISGPHYRMLYQQWQTLADLLVYVFFWIRFGAQREPVNLHKT